MVMKSFEAMAPLMALGFAVISSAALMSCGWSVEGESSSGSVKIESAPVTLFWPEGYSYNPETREISMPGGAPGAALATLPAYVTGITLTATNGVTTASWDVPFDTMTVEFALPPGEWTFTLVVYTNIPGLSFSDSVTVDLAVGVDVSLDFSLDVNAPPSIGPLSGPSSTYKRTSVSFSISASDLDPDDVLTYSWDGGGGAVTGSGASINWSADRKGSYTVCVTVDDGHGGSQKECAGITVINRNPVIRSVSISSPSPTVGQSVVATVDGYDPDGDRVTYTWTDDPAAAARSAGGSGQQEAFGWTDTGQEVTYTPSSMGSKTLTVTADDGDGGRASASAAVTPSSYRIDFNGNVPLDWSGDTWSLDATVIGDSLRLTCDATTLGASGSNLRIQIVDGFSAGACSGAVVASHADLADTDPPATLQWSAAQSQYCLDISEICSGGCDHARYDCYLLSNAPVTATLVTDNNP